jgi:hypothetical protein
MGTAPSLLKMFHQTMQPQLHFLPETQTAHGQTLKIKKINHQNEDTSSDEQVA